jgi:hypothetical protein
MLYFRPKIAIWVNFGGSCNECKMLVYFMDTWAILWTFCILCSNLVYFLRLVYCTKTNLATLLNSAESYVTNA